MQMTEYEIRKSYNDAKDKNKQICILADLNCCSKDEIKVILGLVKKDKKNKGIFEEIIESLQDELDSLNEEIKKLEDRYTKVVHAMDIISDLKMEGKWAKDT